jgi:dTDP-4-amino-4,6-dideoxygalactose transaminase
MTAYRIPLSVPTLGGNERSYLAECIETNFVSSVGPFVSRFEAEFERMVGASHAVACATGTAAIHLALAALGIGRGDEVLVQDLTFVASANPVRYCGADVTVVDSEDETWNLDPALVVDELARRRRAGERQPAAIVAVHLLGHPAKMDELVECAREFGVPIVEDATEALGASWTSGGLAGRCVGTVGAVGCFSFNGNKIITAGGGGMAVCADEQLATRIRHLSAQARLPGPEYRHDDIGFNYRLTNIAAAVGLAQLEQLRHFVERKRDIAKSYDDALGRVDGVVLPPHAAWADRSSWLYTILLASRQQRERVRLELDGAGIEARPIWPPLHDQAPYAAVRRLGGAVASSIADRALSLPSSVSLTPGEQEDVAAHVARAVGVA